MGLAETRGVQRRARRLLAGVLLVTFGAAEPNAVCAAYCAISQLRVSHGHPMAMALLPCHSGVQAVHRPAIFPMPEFALRLIFGELASVLLASQRAVPHGAVSAGYRFRYSSLDDALGEILGG